MTKFAPVGEIITRCAGRRKEPYRKVVFTSDLQRQTFRQLFVARSGNVGPRILLEFDALLAGSARTSRRSGGADADVTGGEHIEHSEGTRPPNGNDEAGPDWSELVE